MLACKTKRIAGAKNRGLSTSSSLLNSTDCQLSIDAVIPDKVQIILCSVVVSILVSV